MPDDTNAGPKGHPGDPGDDPALTGVTIDGPTAGISVGGAEGRLLRDPVGGQRDQEEAGAHGRPGPSGPESPAATDIDVSASTATSPGVMAERQRIAGESAPGDDPTEPAP